MPFEGRVFTYLTPCLTESSADIFSYATSPPTPGPRVIRQRHAFPLIRCTRLHLVTDYYGGSGERERERMTTPVGLLCYLSLFTCVYLTIAVYTSRAFVMRYLVANKLKANISCRFNCLRVIISGGTIFFRYRRGTRLNETVITMIEWPLVCCSKNQNDRSCHSDFGKNLAEGQSSRIRKL